MSVGTLLLKTEGPPRVAAIDDEPAVLRLVEAVLGRSCTFEGHSDPAEGVAAVLARPPALLLTDFHMPEVTGYDVIERVRRAFPDPLPDAGGARGRARGAPRRPEERVGVLN